MSGDIFTNDFKSEPYWWENARPFSTDEDLPHEADLVIVGAGICGLSAARRAIELGACPLVLDAGAIGGGASSRSGAMVSSGQKLLISGAARALGSDAVTELSQAHADAFEYVRTLTTTGGISASFRETGRLFLAALPRDLEQFASHARILSDAAGVTARTVSREELRCEIDSDLYHGGLLVEEFGGLNPAMLVQSLARDVEGRGGILRSHVRVEGIARSGADHVVKTSKGSIKARHVLFATNGYTDAALTSLRRRIAPVGSYMIATEELGNDRVAALMPKVRMYSDTKRNLWFFRPSPDNKRILFGARPGLFPNTPEMAAGYLHRFLSRVFPALENVRISHAWTGTIAMTRRHIQHIGQREGVWFAVGCNGSGIAIMPWLGRLTIERMLGNLTQPSVFERISFGVLPNIGGTPWYVPFAAGYFSFADWLDRKRAGL
ncbi:FAD-binding oxidoreductase [Rhizobium sp. L1K21]|uniref:NAD(P)/FAD-dependent oxidoreductase n=1 Tax=Rhizobium sp. L1K21 TaxID=2954933 RepID=UPI0020934509|nr:FAD-binding oxidoreductase [Rhizobium sp. L1K21]MCO6187614.1 FAD-binding oxidoreductase [Rhizobium sp. L1K21]